ncbi:Helitron helicase [Phytophthora megakarya]|uniref:ATP-dependent DNA helicase n=1 Tax=Phytophthora megakarya TaxID=4795 RepID=A0A225WIB7_9STRA|nr:Helitron helicase [Phytophthora megakarya]
MSLSANSASVQIQLLHAYSSTKPKNAGAPKKPKKVTAAGERKDRKWYAQAEQGMKQAGEVTLEDFMEALTREQPSLHTTQRRLSGVILKYSEADSKKLKFRVTKNPVLTMDPFYTLPPKLLAACVKCLPVSNTAEDASIRTLAAEPAIETILIPLHFQNAHWRCVAVRVSVKRICYYDPLNQTPYRNAGKSDYDLVPMNNPIQVVAYSCSTYMSKPHKSKTALFKTLLSLQLLLEVSGYAVADFDLPELDPTLRHKSLLENSLICREMTTYSDLDLAEVGHAEDQLNNGQRVIYDQIIGTGIKYEQGKKLFLSTDQMAPGNLHCFVASLQKYAWKEKSRYPYTTIKIPLKLNDFSACNITRQSYRKGLIEKARLITWDEAPMAHRYIFEAVDRTLRAIVHNVEEPFGGIIFDLSGDFR